MNSIYIGSNGAWILERVTNGFFRFFLALPAAAAHCMHVLVCVCTKNFHYRLLSTFHSNGNIQLPAFCHFNVNRMIIDDLI